MLVLEESAFLCSVISANSNSSCFSSWSFRFERDPTAGVFNLVLTCACGMEKESEKEFFLDTDDFRDGADGSTSPILGLNMMCR